MSPVWIMKAGLAGSALTLPIASSSVPSAFGLAGLSKPTWLSLICRKVRPLGSLRHGLADEAERARHAAGDGPQHAGAGPGHAFQHLAAADAVMFLPVNLVWVGFHDRSPVAIAAYEDQIRATGYLFPAESDQRHSMNLLDRGQGLYPLRQRRST